MTQPRFETTVHAVHGSPAPPLNSPCRGWLEALLPEGRLRVITANGLDCTCDWLDTGSLPHTELASRDINDHCTPALTGRHISPATSGRRAPPNAGNATSGG